MTVYLDSVFALNFAVNWLLLRAAARLGAAAVRPRRIAAAAALGAAYAVAVYLPGCGVLAGWAGKLAVTAALLAVAFGLRRETLRRSASPPRARPRPSRGRRACCRCRAAR